MSQTSDNQDKTDRKGGEDLPPATEKTRNDDEHTGETSSAAKTVRARDVSSDDNKVSSGEGLDFNPS